METMYLPKFGGCKITFISLASHAYINNNILTFPIKQFVVLWGFYPLWSLECDSKEEKM